MLIPRAVDNGIVKVETTMMGANLFLGLKLEMWSSADAKHVADVTSRLLRNGRCG
jgi:hypothetical protein